tara:strand:+ start:74 stop:274 length:201 start_codon:yes stop_codon:yes gene_type:complete
MKLSREDFDSLDSSEYLEKEKFLSKYFIYKNMENQRFLYPNGHRTTHQMRWFKGSRDRGLKSDIAA